MIVVILLAVATLLFVRSLQVLAQPNRLTVNVRFDSGAVLELLTNSEDSLTHRGSAGDETYPKMLDAPPRQTPLWDLSITDVFLLDRGLALAKLRIELERELRRIGSEADLIDPKRPVPLGRLLRTFEARQVLPLDLLSAIRDITTVANVAVHGGEVADDTAAAQVINVGKLALDQLQRLGNSGDIGSSTSSHP